MNGIAEQQSTERAHALMGVENVMRGLEGLRQYKDEFPTLSKWIGMPEYSTIANSIRWFKTLREQFPIGAPVV